MAARISLATSQDVILTQNHRGFKLRVDVANRHRSPRHRMPNSARREDLLCVFMTSVTGIARHVA